MVALLILSMAVIFSLDAGRQARASAAQALELRRANTLLSRLVETGPRTFDDTTGTSDKFSWTIQTRATGGERPIIVCHRQVSLTNLESLRTYQVATLETCPVETQG